MESRTTPRQTARQAIADLAVASDPGWFIGHHQHGGAGLSTGHAESPHPLAALRSGALLLRALRDELSATALAARAQGETWPAVADALGLTDGEVADAEAAYLSTLGVRGSACGAPLGVLWTCGSCASVVRDLGPELPDPVQREAGHGNDCPRHVREIIAWRSEVQQ